MALAPLARRGFLGRIVALPILGAGGSFFVRRAEAASGAVIAQIDAAEHRCVAAKKALEAALPAYSTSFPRPHWSIDHDHRPNLCVRWQSVATDIPGGPRYLPNDRTLDEDCDAFWAINPDDLDARRWHGRRTRRLKARVKRYKARIAAHQRRHQLEELERACENASRDMYELAKAVFARPARTLAEIRVQARMLQAFGATLSERQDWETYQAGMFGRQIAESLCKLERAA